MGEAIRLNKLIAMHGIASRREADRLIQEGEVTVAGKVVTEPGTRVDPEDVHVKVRGRLLPRTTPRPTYVLLHKPLGVVTTDEDPQGRRTVQHLLEDLPVRVEPVGRLDYHTEGVLLLTNDGDLAHRLTHPRFKIPKTYLVKVTGQFTDRKAAALEKGIPLEDGRTLPSEVTIVEAREKNTWVQVTVYEGRNRLVRRMMEFLGHGVLKLKRTAFAGLTLRDLSVGSWRELTPREVEVLKAIARGEEAPEVRLVTPAEAASRAPRRKAAWAQPKDRKERPGPSRPPRDEATPPAGKPERRSPRPATGKAPSPVSRALKGPVRRKPPGKVRGGGGKE